MSKGDYHLHGKNLTLNILGVVGMTVELTDEQAKSLSAELAAAVKPKPVHVRANLYGPTSSFEKTVLLAEPAPKVWYVPAIRYDETGSPVRNSLRNVRYRNAGREDATDRKDGVRVYKFVYDGEV